MWDKPALLNWFANLFFAISVVLFIYGLLYVFVHLPILPIREVKVIGATEHVNHEQVQLIVDAHLKGNFFTLDLVKTREAFEKLPWARSVSVRRRWPDALNVEIEEHIALARWGDIALVNTRGELFHAASDANLPMFYGPGDGVKEVTKQYAGFSKILNRAEIKVTQITLSPRRAWEIKTDKNMIISLGRLDMAPRLSKFATVYESVLSHLNADIKYADLRYPNGFAVRKPKKLSMQVLPKAHKSAFTFGVKGSENEQSA
ncbi:MAG: cell division protein FtsQ/DivIB [Methylophilaceae bacterium]